MRSKCRCGRMLNYLLKSLRELRNPVGVSMLVEPGVAGGVDG